ncbi:unnamed protein product [Didymodactylos carnosus]|uniref:Carrier domain-containing protein n=1 Tax=Didymodactylos carnosus TaxID=1234261 RepID=A0A814PG65_9BILA|nr:unnamed protein product [Didymodactylos carnosus]CAF3870134.1 unnamed protein product [Didymodactylos carnosus]
MSFPLSNNNNNDGTIIHGTITQHDNDNNTSTENIYLLFEKIANKYAQKIGLQNSEYSISYQECLSFTLQLSNCLSEKVHVTSNTIIGMWMINSIEYVISILTAIKFGATFVPLDANHPIDRLQYIVKNANINLILTTNSLIAAAVFNLPVVNVQLLRKDKCSVLQIESSLLSNSSLENCQIAYDSCYIIYTSGTTGRPKGVVLNENGLKNLAFSQIELFAIKETDIVAQNASICFDASISEIFMTLVNGAQLFIFQQHEKIGNIFIDIMNRYHITVLTMTPSLLSIYDPSHLPFLKTIISAGESCPSALAKKWFNGGNKTLRFFNAYGPSEATVCTTIFEVNYNEINYDIIPIGFPIHNVYLKVVDEKMNNVSIGMPGELLIGGMGVSQAGYIYPADNKRFVKINETIWYKSGDIVVATSLISSTTTTCCLSYLGRIDNQVKINGCRIELNEIETVILSCAGVLHCTAIIHQCEICKKKYQKPSIAAYVYTTDDSNINKEFIRHHVQKYVPSFMVPSYIILEKHWHLPMTANGKIDRKQLFNDITIHSNQTKNYVTEYSKIEKPLSQIWFDLFDCKIVLDSTTTTFSEYGGNSLMLTTLSSLILKKLNIKIGLGVIHIHMTLKQMVEAIQNNTNKDYSHTQLNLILQDMYTTNSNLNKFNLISISKINKKYSTLLLTGVTGYLGCFLLYELLLKTDLIIYCLIRSSSQQKCRQRIIKNLKKYNLLLDENNLLHYEFDQRIRLICGDLSKCDFELDNNLIQQIDSILHCAAITNFNLCYEQLRQVNVQSTKYLLNICINHSIPMYYISSLSIFLFHHYYKRNSTEQIEISEKDNPDLDSIFGGYGQSKFVADYLILKAFTQGLSGIIFRLGEITGSTKCGIGSIDDLFFLMLKGCIQCKAFPNLTFPVILTPVDVTCQLIVQNIKNHFHRNNLETYAIVHLSNQTTIPFNKQFELLYELGCCQKKLVSLTYDQWLERLIYYHQQQQQSPNVLLPFLPFLQSAFWNHVDKWPKFVNEIKENTIDLCPCELFTIYANQWKKMNMFER